VVPTWGILLLEHNFLSSFGTQSTPNFYVAEHYVASGQEHFIWVKYKFREITRLFIPRFHCAGYFYLIEQRSSVVSPAESRNMNEACYVGIFDAHDLWHFLSASGIFFIFMFILTLGKISLETLTFFQDFQGTLSCKEFVRLSVQSMFRKKLRSANTF
jgi:hypothetical protein